MSKYRISYVDRSGRNVAARQESDTHPGTPREVKVDGRVLRVRQVRTPNIPKLSPDAPQEVVITCEKATGS